MQIDFSKGRVSLVIVGTDLRAGYRRLASIAADYLHIDVSKGNDYVVFISKTRCQAKIIFSDRCGTVLINRTLHQGRFQQLMSKATGPAAKPLTGQELSRYLDGDELEVVRKSYIKG